MSAFFAPCCQYSLADGLDSEGDDSNAVCDPEPENMQVRSYQRDAFRLYGLLCLASSMMVFVRFQWEPVFENPSAWDH